ncbi:hypothetical protein CFP56_023554 [Quercus suber]|uniref:Uncharacterized protein n=1 Tax=Quercus suber TaxID=58331 RepID=A0AAW0K9F9_QUESU
MSLWDFLISLKLGIFLAAKNFKLFLEDLSSNVLKTFVSSAVNLFKNYVIAKWKQVGESQGVLADRVHEGERNQLHSDESSHSLYRSIGYFQALGCEIPNEFNHRNDGNSISFLVRNSRCIPLAVCVAFGPTNEFYHFLVEFVVNGCLEIQHNGFYLERSESCRLWFISNPMYAWEKKLRFKSYSNPIVLYVVSIAIACTESPSLQDVGNRGSEGWDERFMRTTNAFYKDPQLF